jgi:TolB-like protein
MSRAAAVALVLALTAPARGSVTSGFFADIPLGARAMGMGGAHGALADDAYAALYNPAGLAQIDDLVLTAEYADLFEGGLARQAYFGALFRAAGIHHSISFQNVGIGFKPLPGSLDEGTFLYAAGYPLRDDLTIGGGIRYMNVSSTFALVDGSGFGFDAGVLWRPWRPWSFGASIRNFASRVSFGTGTDESIPQVWRLGAAYRHGLRWRAAMDLVGERGAAVKELRGGGEYWILHPALGRFDLEDRGGIFGGRAGASAADLAFALRAGFRHEFVGRNKTAPTVGLSVGLGGLLLDYAYEADNAGPGETNRFSLTYAFPSTAAPRRRDDEPARREEPAEDRPVDAARAPGARPARSTVVVLAFDDRTGDPDLAWLAQGVAEVVAAELARIGIGVVPRREAAGAAHTHTITGTLARIGPDRVVVAARLHDARSEDARLVDFAEADGAPMDVFGMGRRIAEALAPAVVGGGR